MRVQPTPAELELWKALRNRTFGGYKFRRQQPLGPYIADFCCLAAKLVIEIDGGNHAKDTSKDYDRIRTEYLRSAGIRVLRFWNDDVTRNLTGVLQAIHEELKRT
jgi:adenine-specific DNA-methyltransferase